MNSQASKVDGRAILHSIIKFPSERESVTPINTSLMTSLGLVQDIVSCQCDWETEYVFRLRRTNSSKTLFEESINNFKSQLRDRGYPNNIVEKTLAEVKLTERKYALQEKQATKNHIAFRLTIQPISAKSQRGFNEQMAYHWETTPALRDFSGTTHFLLQKRQISKRYNC